MKKFTHNGLDIRVTETGQFAAKTPHGIVQRPSLAALRKALDGVTPFKPFTAFVWDWISTGSRGGHGFKTVQIIGTVKNSRLYGPRAYWQDSGFRKYREVFEDTPQNRKLAKTWCAMKRAAERDRKRWDKAVAKDYKRIVKLVP